mmetsp:Transcript_14424/g.39415  ORF Transcript_14424/g.39415 Transcript_14424/m.39415 type:complete len:255 (+) Transcript_14424:719-1483(+)
MTGPDASMKEPSPPCGLEPTSTKHGLSSASSQISSPCEGPFLQPRASSTLCIYVTMASSLQPSRVWKVCIPKYTNWELLHGLLSYSQIATHLCSPSTDTESTTYSLPRKNSCTRTAVLTSPKTSLLPTTLAKHALACATHFEMWTPSVPADCTGFKTHHSPSSASRTPSALMKSYTSSQVPHSSCFAALKPESRTRSPMCFLFLLKGLVAEPLVGMPGMSSVMESKAYNPDSQPFNTAVTLKGKRQISSTALAA